VRRGGGVIGSASIAAARNCRLAVTAAVGRCGCRVAAAASLEVPARRTAHGRRAQRARGGAPAATRAPGSGGDT